LARFRRDIAFGLSLCSALHHRDTRHHWIAAMFADQHHSIAVTQCGNPCSASGNAEMDSAASRNVTSGFRPGNMIGSKNP
jgi:hypothetical protein